MIAVALTGCAAKSTIAPYGKDTFILNVADSSGMAGSSDLRVRAAQDAAKHCKALGKEPTIEESKEKGAQFWTGTSSTLVFKCV